MQHTQHSADTDLCRSLLDTIWAAALGAPEDTQSVAFRSQGQLPSFFAVTDLAAATMGAAGLALASLVQSLEQATGSHTQAPMAVEVDRRLASFWFASTLRPEGWKLPQHAEVASADYLAKDGWLRLHTNASHHRDAAIRVLNCAATSEAMAAAVSTWSRDNLVDRVIAEGGCAATMLSPEQWQQHPQGQAVLQEPLIHWTLGSRSQKSCWSFERTQPLKSLKILDMTRVLAGPAATRMLAGLGAQVLRLDPPMWDESNAPEMTLGKKCAELDLRDNGQRAQWIQLLSEADVLVHGYRSDALASLGLDAQARQAIKPGLIDVSLDAYGFSGPWHNRRGFDSLVQMSIGIAHAGQQFAQSARPMPLPVQALDHATGYLLATAVLRGLEQRIKTGQGSIARASLARTGALLMTTMDADAINKPPLTPECSADWGTKIETTAWGPARRIAWPLTVAGIEMDWTLGAGPLKRHPPSWS